MSDSYFLKLIYMVYLNLLNLVVMLTWFHDMAHGMAQLAVPACTPQRVWSQHEWAN